MNTKIIASAMAAATIFGSALCTGAYADEKKFTADKSIVVSYGADGTVSRKDQFLDGLILTPRIVVILTDGTEVDLGEINDTNGSKNTIETTITKDQLVSALKSQGKSLDDVRNFMSYVKVGYNGINFESYNAKFGYDVHLNVKTGGHWQSAAYVAFPSEAYVTDLELKEYRLDTINEDKAMYSEYYSRAYKLNEIEEFGFYICFNTYVPKNDQPDNKITVGDVNSDGKIDIEDSVMVINHINGVKPLTDDQNRRADADFSKDIDIEDAVCIINHINGISLIKST